MINLTKLDKLIIDVVEWQKSITTSIDGYLIRGALATDKVITDLAIRNNMCVQFYGKLHHLKQQLLEDNKDDKEVK